MRGETRSYAAARRERAADVDRWLTDLLRTACGTPYGRPGKGPDPRDGRNGDERGPLGGVALVAVGSLGRSELAPGSDLDLVLLHDGRDDIARVADRVWYPVWDSGVRLDHSVRTVEEAAKVAREDLKAVLGLIQARHVAGDPELTRAARETVLSEWRADSRRRLGELREAADRRTETSGELAFLLEPDLRDAHGGLRDVQAMQAVAAAWVASAPGPRVREAYELLLDVRHGLHLVTARGTDRLVLQEQDAVAGMLGLLDAEALMRRLAEAGRTIAHAFDGTWRTVDRLLSGPAPRGRRPLADGVVEHGGEVVLARGADPRKDPVLVLRAAAAAAEAGLPLAPATVAALASQSPPLPVPWPDEARDALVALLGAGRAAVPVWEELDQAGVLVRLLPDWERVRHRPQRNPVHRYTVDRHLIETAAGAAASTREVSRPDLLLICALLHDIGKGYPGDHSDTGAVVARDIGARMGLPPADVEILERVVRHHLLLPETATRRDLDDPVTISRVAEAVGSREVLELLAALAVADGNATGPAAWNAWKASLVTDLVRRVRSVLSGTPPRPAPSLSAGQAALARHGGGAVRVNGGSVTVVAPDRSGLLWSAAGVLAAHWMVVRAASAASAGSTAVIEFSVVPEYGSPPDPATLEADLRLVLAGRLDIEERLARRTRSLRPARVPVAPPRVTLVDDASTTATVVEVRAHDRPGLLWRIGRAFGECGLDVRAARVETLGAEAVDVFYVVDRAGRPLTDRTQRAQVRDQVLSALR
ncbi:bifunctional uridylyltransferase/uridylyl-removing enzyme [Planomonospora parontospora subsp. parontospora]|uniref:Bifunctional uridylyltransferase/uridylyl-removing enzyme n=2 Tax=Planomonospora parontospora TaxID=58119 RepID=A0AA37F5L3_9ACTN|nr:[protein-PII] uridylyltransferase [Planomonospora parontospora]GGK74973.1 bifunctional uridylyltransferase/uridylyl-removing enzyme [Planomonospora parontospora]GII09525.1 bifunctional uridylyltransferase/uridylyl-removing enzyme [Planomonospora parontospora subsp. parontospora]